MKSVLGQDGVRGVMDRLKAANAAVAARWPGESAERQPVHTVYGGAHLFKADTAGKLGALAQKAFETHAPDAATFGRALGIKDGLQALVYERVREKLGREAVEDFRIDFEDGFGNRPDQEENEAAARSATEVAKGLKGGTLPPFLGIRVKSLSEELKHRAVRTLDVFVGTLLQESGGKLPPGFVVTLPKVTAPAQVAALATMLELLEKAHGLVPGVLKIEIMVETTQAIMNEHGASALPLLATAGKGRVIGAHLGAYDYTAACDVTAAHQDMAHPACDFARQMMKVAYAGQPIWLSDGATNVLPVGATEVVHRAWRLSHGHIQSALRIGFYQGWDLHPAQLPVRYGAVYGFFLDGLQAATERLKAFVAKAAQATLLGDVFDDAATGQGLLNYFLRALNCGAITLDEVQATGLTLAEIQTRSFLRILAGRRLP